MVSVESATLNVDAKPFEMFVPPAQLSGESSDSSAGEQPDPNDETENNVFVIPDDDLRDRIIKQVEFYFSDVNLTKDAFLLKHVTRNKHGRVSLKLIASFKKMKTLTKDWRVVAYSMKSSDKLILNDNGTKIGRKDPLPQYDETTPSRTVIAMNLPLLQPTVESVSELFSKCGEIALTRILRPGAPIPPDIKQFVHKHPGLGSGVCAVIEFTTPDGAAKAVADMGGKNNDWRAMHVVEMAKGKKTIKKELAEGEEEKKKKTKKKKSGKNDEGKQGVKSTEGNEESPWVQRRKMAAGETGKKVECVGAGQKVPEGVIRLPKGPDGTMGFHEGARRAPVAVLG